MDISFNELTYELPDQRSCGDDSKNNRIIIWSGIDDFNSGRTLKQVISISSLRRLAAWNRLLARGVNGLLDNDVSRLDYLGVLCHFALEHLCQLLWAAANRLPAFFRHERLHIG